MSSELRFGLLIEYVDDVQAAKPFYTDILGLKVEREAPDFIQFADPAGVNVGIASDGSLGNAREPEVFWLVDDAAEAFRTLPGAVEVSYPLTEKPFGTVFGITDPAGEVQYVLELAKERPSAAVS
jgi:catechol 2,3-dioxygenase-like lactoylglutathione lyase family enzyme